VIPGVVARHNAAKAEVEASYRVLAEYDKFVGARGTLPFAVASAPVEHWGMIASPRLDVSRWRTIARLKGLKGRPSIHAMLRR
jgi:hypothetical protein